MMLQRTRRFPGEQGRFSGASSGSPENTSRVFRITTAYNPLTATRTGPWPAAAGAGGEADARHSGLCGRRASWAHGDWRPRQAPGLHRPQSQQARYPWCRGSSLRALSLLPPARNTTTRKLDRLRATLELRVRCALAGTLPGPSCGFLASRKREGTNKAMPGGATPGTTLIRPLPSAVAQMCRTFQKSSVIRVVRPCRDSMPSTLLSESRCRISPRTTRASPKRSDSWLAEATAVTGTSAFRRQDR